jgi:hypothetical protein
MGKSGANRTVIAIGAGAAAFALIAAPTFAQTPRAPGCSVEGLDARKLARAKPDLSSLPGVSLGRQTVDDVIRAIDEGKPAADVEAAKAKIPAARDTCAGALTSKSSAMGNIPAHLCVALSDFVQHRDDAAGCRIDWIEFLGDRLRGADQERARPYLGDALETQGKILIARQDLNGAKNAYQRAVDYQETVPRLFNLAQLQEKRSETSDAIATYQKLNARPDIGERKYDVLRSWATLVSNTSTSVAEKRERWNVLRQYRSTPEANLRYAETFLGDSTNGSPDQQLTQALIAATTAPVNNADAVQANARSVAWYYRAVFAARTAGNREAWKTVAQYAGDGSAAPRASRLKCIAEVAGGSLRYPADTGACPSSASTPEQLFLRGVMILRASQFLPPGCTAELRSQGRPCTPDYSTRWLGLVGEARQTFSIGRNMANDKDVVDWLEQGDQNSPKLLELLKAGEAIAQDWQTTRPGFANCTRFPEPPGLDSKARAMFGSLDLLNCAHN